MFTPLITHDLDGTALAAPVNAARCNGAAYKTRTIDDLRIKDDRLRAAIDGTGHLLFDGGMGTMLQAAGMKAGALPELLNFEEPQVITDIQRQYVEAGCDVITANTFGANAHKLDGAATVADVFAAAVACAREAGAHYVAGDIGPIGALLRPLGTLSFDEAYDLFAEEVRAGVDAGVDLFIIETMTDLAEIKAAVLACRENSDLPVFATMTFEEDGRTFLGTSPEVAAITLDAIGADVLGINCSQGPAELRGLAARMLTVTDKPVMVQANAGLPHVDDDGNTVYDYDAAKKKAEELQKTWKKDGGDADALGALAEENSGDSTSNYNKGKYEKASKEDVTDTLKAWLFDEKRKEGDTALLKDEDAQGYQLVYFEGYGEKYHWQDVSIAALQKEDYDKWYEKVEKTYDDKITTSFMYRFV